MAGMTYTEDRATFEDQIFQPPRTARLMAEASRYVSRMEAADREAFMRITFERFYELRNMLKCSDDIRRYWIVALNAAAATRQFWKIWFTWHEYKWVKGKEWRGRDCYA
jgi:hypothetical protein